MNKRALTITIVCLAVIFGGLVGWNIFKAHLVTQYMAKFKPPAPVVSATTAKSVIWQQRVDTVGTLQALDGVNVTTEIGGLVKHVLFHSGQFVKKGAPLVQLDDRNDKQDLKNFSAQLQLAKLAFERQERLLKKRVVARSQYDTARAQLASAESNLAKTQITINQKTIKAPFAGKVGLRSVNLGQYLAPGSNIVSLQRMDPLVLNFSLPGEQLGKIHKGQTVELSVAAYPERKFKGFVQAWGAQINADTRNINIQARVVNTHHQLYPGMFSKVTVLLGKSVKYVVIPQTAVSYNLYGDTVYVLQHKNVKGKDSTEAVQKNVTLGPRRDTLVAVTSGLTSGDQVITAGQDKLTGNGVVKVDNTIDITKHQPSQVG